MIRTHSQDEMNALAFARPWRTFMSRHDDPVLNPQRLGGWLILVALVVLFSPVRIAFELGPLYGGMIADGRLASVLTPDSGSYMPALGALICIEIVLNALLFMAWLVLAYLFFSQRRVFPRLFSVILLFSFSFILVDSWVVSLILPAEPVFDPDTLRELLRALIACSIWVPYMHISKRVKATFVR